MMKKLVLAVAALFALAVPAAFAAEHDMHGSPHDMHGSKPAKGAPAYEKEIDGVVATFRVQPMAEAMQAMGMAMPKGVKETHHISLNLKDAKSGKALAEGEATVKLQAPDKSEQTRELMAMHGHFGGDFVMAQKGKYGVMCKFKTADGKVRQAKFWYTVK